MVAVSWKSWRVPASGRAWPSGLVSSAASNSETTSKENSATARVKDRVDADPDCGRRQRNCRERRDREQRADARGAFVKRLDRGLVVRVGAVVEVVDPRVAGPRHQLVQHRLAARRKRLAVEVRDRLLEVIP